MSAYIVVHHRKDPEKPWSNAWLDDDDDLLEAITTTREVASRCRQALHSGESVYIHRCAYATERPVICCSAQVASIDQVGSSWLVKFKGQKRLAVSPPLQPMLGTNSYEA